MSTYSVNLLSRDKLISLSPHSFLYVLSANATSIDVMSLAAAGQATKLQTVNFAPLADKAGLLVSEYRPPLPSLCYILNLLPSRPDRPPRNGRLHIIKGLPNVFLVRVQVKIKKKKNCIVSMFAMKFR